MIELTRILIMRQEYALHMHWWSFEPKPRIGHKISLTSLMAFLQSKYIVILVEVIIFEAEGKIFAVMGNNYSINCIPDRNKQKMT